MIAVEGMVSYHYVRAVRLGSNQLHANYSRNLFVELLDGEEGELIEVGSSAYQARISSSKRSGYVWL